MKCRARLETHLLVLGVPAVQAEQLKDVGCGVPTLRLATLPLQGTPVLAQVAYFGRWYRRRKDIGGVIITKPIFRDGHMEIKNLR